MKLKDLNPCEYESRIGSTTRAEWNKSAQDAMWLVSRAYENGSMSRRTLISLTLKTIKPIFPLMPEASRNCMASLQRWVDGDDSVDLKQIRTASYAATDAATDAAYAAYYAAVAAYAAYYARAVYAAYAAYAAAAYAAYAATKVSVQIDVRKHITVDECCSFLGIDPDEVLE